MKITTKNISKSYSSREVLKDLNIEVRPGQILGLLGPNGAGKSTTIKILTGQLAPTSGSIFVDDKEYSFIPTEIKKKIGIMPQEVIIWEELTTKENLEFTAKLQKLSSEESKKQVDFLMESLKLTKEENTLAKHLSGGYKRRLNLANSIIHNPEVIFLDEPTPGVDAHTRRFLWDFIRSLKEKNRAVVLTDHYLEEAEKLSDYVVIIDDGKLIAEGTVEELKKAHTHGASIDIVFDVDEDPKKIESLIPELNKIANLVTLSKENQISILDSEGISMISKVDKLLKDNNILADAISMKEPSLEDVFIILTGKNIRE